MLSSVDTIWVLLGAVLVFFMQAGFAMVETGFTRAKNAGNIIMKNLMDFALGTIVFWLIGFGLMFAGDGPLIGGLDFFIQGNYGGSYPSSAYIIFQTVFCATAATIVSGAMAERTKFSAYCLYSILISLFVYPISGHWIWGGGWLAELGFHDFAGSTAVHMVGGIAALIGAAILGPRIGKYDRDKKPKAILGHSLTLGALGVFILWFCWFGFNGCSTVSMTGDDSIQSAANIFVTTNMAAASATVAVMCITWIRYKKPDVSMTLNGSLAGLVAVTAGCDLVDPFGAFLIGLIAGFVVVFGIEFVDKKLHVDDPVGAIGVHGCCGAAGTLMVGLFATDGGLFYGGGFHFLGVQALGVVSVAAWVSICMLIIFTLIKKTIGLRVSETEELDGLDIHEHGLASSYADFMPTTGGMGMTKSAAMSQSGQSEAVVQMRELPAASGDTSAKLTKITVITNQRRFDDLKNALNTLGINGMTFSQVLGYGVQKGHTAYYRGVEMDATLLPKIKVEVVVCAIPVQTVVDTIKQVLYTGNPGDGKIFIYDVENVIRVSTGQEGLASLNDD